MKHFSFKRYAQILRWDVVNSWRKMLNMTIGMAIGLFCIENLLMPKPYSGAIDPYSASMYEGCMVIVIFTFVFYLIYGSTTILRDMRTKQERIYALMLPGTNMEKFLSKLTISSIGFVLLAIVALVVADGARMLVGALFQHVTSDSLLPYIWKRIAHDEFPIIDIYSNFSYFNLFTGWLFGLSVGTLGGVLFNKVPFVSTALCMFIFSTLLGTVLMSLDSNSTEALAETANNLYGWTSAVINLVLALLLFALSYLIFCRIQAVNNKFLNL